MATYGEAYGWMQYVQKKLLFKPFSVHLDTSWCESLGTHTITMYVHYDGELTTVTWSPYAPKGFDADKQRLIDILKEKGYTI